MTRRDWDNLQSRAIGVFLNGDELNTETPRGEEVRDESFLILFNAHFEEIAFRLPARRLNLRRHQLHFRDAGARRQLGNRQHCLGDIDRL